MPLYVAACLEADPHRRAALERAGVRFIGTETHEGGVALPELLEDLAALGMASVLVEGGAKVASAFLADGLVDRIVLFQGPEAIGEDGIASPIDADHIPAGFRKLREMRFRRRISYCRSGIERHVRNHRCLPELSPISAPSRPSSR